MELNFVSGPGSSRSGWTGPKVVENKEGANAKPDFRSYGPH